jgi:hypothetical protein
LSSPQSLAARCNNVAFYVYYITDTAHTNNPKLFLPREKEWWHEQIKPSEEARGERKAD